MTDNNLYAATDIIGDYSPTILPSDFCVAFPNVGLVFSITFSEQKTCKEPVLVELVIHTESGEGHFTESEGKFQPPTRSLTGEEIPSRLYLVVSEQHGLSPSLLRSSRIEIISIRTTKRKTVFHNFQIHH